jgi:uncharacterized protein YnzC (UPF0291/DUF896 family)
MLSKEKIKRINDLAKKAKAEGLSKVEEEEQQVLRQEYVDNFRKSFKKTLHSVKVVDNEGNDVTPDKLKQSKQNNKNFLN